MKISRVRLAGNYRRRVTFLCNICEMPCHVPLPKLSREVVSCFSCGSTPRFRAVVSVLSQELFGAQLALPRFPKRPALKGLGFSDWDGYAHELARKMSYTNTFLDRSPRLDITRPPQKLRGAHDFVIASEVFEHVVPPVETAFRHVYDMLKPHGFLLLTVPFTLERETMEHFPNLFDFEVLDFKGGKVLVNRTATGQLEVYDNPRFHRGDGLTLEMRLFCKDGLTDSLKRAGFSEVRFLSGSTEFGACWPESWSLPVVAHKSSGGQ